MILLKELRQEDPMFKGMPGLQDEFKTTLGNLVKLYLTKE